MTRPSDLDGLQNEVAPKYFISFLRDVCVSDVLDNDVVSYRNSTELDAERIRICQILSRVDSPRADEYAQEIAAITQAAMIEGAIAHLDQSKIYIDTAGLKNSLGTAFRERYARFLAFSKISEELRKNLRVLRLARAEGREIVILIDEALSIFKTLHNDIRTRFISSAEYGLDFYLSVRIRHGTLSGHISYTVRKRRSRHEKDLSGGGV